MKKKRTILVTGGAGFIGSHMVEALLKDENDVIVFDNLSTGDRKNIPPKATFIKGDTANKSDVKKLFNSFSFDAVFHIAGNASIIKSFSTPLLDFKKNFVGTVHVVSECVRTKVPRLLYASSMTIYGHPQNALITETTSPVPVSYYGISKYAAERFVHATATRTDLTHPFHVTSLRMFNVYGPRQSLTNPYQGVMGIFIGNILREEPVTIYGDGKQSRDLIYIDDIVRAWMMCLTNPDTFGKVFNLGSGKSITVNEMIDVLVKKVDYKGTYPILTKNARPGEQRHTRADISYIEKIIGWKPDTSLDDGISNTLQWATKKYGRKK